MLGAAREVIDHPVGLERRIALEIVVEAIEVGLCLGGPDDPHSGRPYLARSVLTSSP